MCDVMISVLMVILWHISLDLVSVPHSLCTHCQATKRGRRQEREREGKRKKEDGKEEGE